jgi:hypothetical protein|tara:strand:+ start:3659 stop:4249 length:591 start_codon:yes stop_codon:yes gene_type:complete
MFNTAKIYYLYQLIDKVFVKKLLIILFVSLIALTPSFTPDLPEDKVDTKAKIKAVFIYNFTKYIEWPADYQASDFTIAILGDNQSLYNELTNMSKVKKVDNKPFKIKLISDVSEIGKSHIVYIPNENSSNLAKAVVNTKGKSALIVTETRGHAGKGASINFIILGGRQKFELNKLTAESNNLKVSSTLANIAVLVN